MPKLSHEALVHLVRAAPEVIVGLLLAVAVAVQPVARAAVRPVARAG